MPSMPDAPCPGDAHGPESHGVEGALTEAGERRIIRRFLLLPRCLGGEMRWFCSVAILQVRVQEIRIRPATFLRRERVTHRLIWRDVSGS